MISMRECFVPRDGFVFCSVDYDAFELRTWAQVCLWTVKRSRLAEVLREGKDPHVELGASLAGIRKEVAYEIMQKKHGTEKYEEFKSHFRQTAKVGNFGFPGGMGAKKFCLAAKKQGVEISESQSIALRKKWLSEWPEATDYFSYINALVDRRAPVVHCVSGRVRGGVIFTSACNSFFQGLAADAAKAAGFALAKEMYTDRHSPLYGSRIVNFVHDEFITEVPRDRMHEAAMRQAEIQCSVAQRWIPDVPVTASPALMNRWYKKADAVFEEGRLVPWKPKSEQE